MIKAIQTYYKGRHFRSRLEARWAVYFDVAGIAWQYEPEGFELGGGLRYLPDFWLPKYRAYIEIKGVWSTELERRKAQLLAYGRETIVGIIVGEPSCEKQMIVSAFVGDGSAPRRNTVDCYDDWLLLTPFSPTASEAALSARFEPKRRGR